MTTLLIACNQTVESGSFMGDQLCSLKTAYLFVENTPGVDRVIMSVSPGNSLAFLWTKFIEKYNVELIYDNFDTGNWDQRFRQWDEWRTLREVNGIHFDHYRELYLRIHGHHRQTLLCGSEQGLGRRNIYSYWYCGQENCPDELPPSVDWFDDTLMYHPPLTKERDVYISPLAKTQGNVVFTMDFWGDVVHRLVNADISVTVGHAGYFYKEEDLDGHPYYHKHWGTHEEWMQQVCRHKLVACGNTGTGWLAAACGVPMVTMEPHNSIMADHRYRECGLRNIIEVVDGDKLDELANNTSRMAEYVARRITEEVRRCIVLTTGCYDVIHAGHIRHLQRAKALGTKLIVALNSDSSIRQLKGPERPINPQAQRQAILEELRCVDEVRIFDGPSAVHLIEEIKPNVLACGFGYTPDKVVGRELVEGYGGRVVITCEGDASNEPSTTKIVKKLKASEVARIVREGAPYSVNPPDKLMLLAQEFLSVSNLPGDIADLGTYKGGTALILRKLAPDKNLHCFDTWSGTPYSDPLCHHKRGEWAVPFDPCRSLIDCQGGSCNLTQYWRGEFPKWNDSSTLVEQLQSTKFCFVYCDMDTYQATKDAIEFFWPRLVKGGKMVFDDYGWTPCAGVKVAVDELLPETVQAGVSDHRKVVPNLYACIVEKR